MKFTKYILMSAALLLGLAGCSKLDKVNTSDELSVKPTMNSVAPIVVTQYNKGEEVTFTWKGADYGYQAEITYNLYASYGDKKILLANNNTTSIAITKGDFNSKMCSEDELALPVGKTSAINVYVTSNIGGNQKLLTSETIEVSVTTVESKIERKGLFVPGSHQGWAPGEAPKVFESTGKGVYSGVINLFDADGNDKAFFKFTSQGNWEGTNYGSALADEVPYDKPTFDLSTDGGAKNHVLMNGIYYFTEVNTNDLKVKYEKFSNLSVVGKFNGWNGGAGVEMVYNKANKNWSAEIDFTKGDDQEFLILFDKNFDNKFAGDPKKITFRGGDNFKAPAAAKYVVTITFNEYPFNVTFKAVE